MINFNVFKICPVCSSEVFELFPTGAFKMDKNKTNAICFDCFESLMNESLLVDCIKCGSDETIIKRKSYTISYGKKSTKTFREVVYCSDCEFEFETEELNEQEEYRRNVFFNRLIKENKKIKQKKK
jgi:Zn finger protein HypA/HybF involved in hydrogenase expression